MIEAKILDLASRVSTPLALAGLLAAITFLVFRRIVGGNKLPRLTKALGAQVILTIVDRLFVLALTALVLGAAGWMMVVTRGHAAEREVPPSRSLQLVLTAEERALLGNAVARLAADLREEWDRRNVPDPDRDRFQAWNIAQMAVALQGLPHRKGAVQGAELESFVEARADTASPSPAGPGACPCWREIAGSPTHPPHLGATTWILYALAGHRIPADAAALEFLLASQRTNGSWCMFRCADDRDASTYTTTWAVLALHGQRSLLPEGDPLADRIDPAVRAAVKWMWSVEVKHEARWHLYPSRVDKGSMISLGNSGLIVHALREVEGPQAIAVLSREWLRGLQSLPPDPPHPTDAERYAQEVVLEDGSGVVDGVSSLVLPWTVIATVDAFPHGSPEEQELGLQFLKRVVAKLVSLSAELRGENWVRAELLMSLRYLQAHVEPSDVRPAPRR